MEGGEAVEETEREQKKTRGKKKFIQQRSQKKLIVQKSKTLVNTRPFSVVAKDRKRKKAPMRKRKRGKKMEERVFESLFEEDVVREER